MSLSNQEFKKMKATINLPTCSTGFLLALAMSGLMGCASVPAPTKELQAAELAITNAQQDNALESAALEMSSAREKLAAARAAVEEKKMEEAARLAEQSRVEAELASAKAKEVKAKAVNEDMKNSTETLKQEMQRNLQLQNTTGVSQ